MTNLEAIKALYVALGNNEADISSAETITEALNIIAAKYDGEDDAQLNADAIANIAAVVDNIIPEPNLIEKSVTANDTYIAANDNADGYSKVTVNVPEQNNAKFIRNPKKGGIFTCEGCLQKIVLPDGITLLDDGVFNNFSNLEEIILPNTLEKIPIDSGYPAFKNCVKLTSIEIPSSVTFISDVAFNGCSNLTSIRVHQNQATSPIAADAPWGATNATVIWTGGES